jgi:ABC-type transport system substrate-binding protein
VLLNAENEMFKNRDVRWALALLIDIKQVSMASYRGAATISAIAVPPTGSAPDYYHQPLESWLQAFEIDTGKRKVKPYDPTVGKQIADMLRPSLKDQIPTDPRRSPSRSAAAGGSPTRRPPPSCWSAPATARRATSGSCPTASRSPSRSRSRARAGRL